MATISDENVLSITNLKAAFKMLDIDQNGSISKDEIKSKLSISDTLIEEIFKKFDTDSNDGIEFNEFYDMMHNN